jgi:hypothetical protein
MVAVRFKTFGSNTAFGDFAPGDILRCSDAMARHLVDELRVAARLEAPAEKVEPVEPPPVAPATEDEPKSEPVPARRKGRK